MTARIRPHSGRGLVGVVISYSTQESLPELRANPLEVDLGGVMPLQTLIDEELERAPARLVHRGEASTDKRSSAKLTLGRGCHALRLLLGAPGHSAEAWVYSSQGQLLATTGGSLPSSLFVCGERQEVRVDYQATSRNGPLAIVSHPIPRAAKELMAHPLAAGRLLAKLAAQGLLGRQPPPSPTVQTLAPDALTKVEVLVPVGRCATVSAALGQGLEGIELRLLDGNQEAQRTEGRYSTGARICAFERRQPVVLTAELRAHAGRGSALVSTWVHSVHR